MKIPFTKLEINFLHVQDTSLKAFPANIRALDLRNNAKLIFQLKLTVPGVK